MPPGLRDAWEAFQTDAARVETARQALLACLPVGRVTPAPVGVGLDLLDDELGAVLAGMAVWRVPAVSREWERCQAAVAAALSAVPVARARAGDSGELEELLAAVGAVVEPLDAWADAERHWLGLRVRA
jgi:hypothetical protein